MDLSYTYWEAEDGWFVGFLDEYPEHLTQGKDLAELEIMLTDLYSIRQNVSTQVPRHPDINENVAKSIIKTLS
jgi:hypothetical protein